MRLTQITIYPIKSTRGLKLESSLITSMGLKEDRLFAVMDSFGKILTARECPKLLQLETYFVNESLYVGSDLKLSKNLNNYSINAKLFGKDVKGFSVDAKVSDFVSEFLGVKVSVVSIKKDSRFVEAKYNIKETAVVSLADVSPIHLISQSSINDLNQRLGKNKQTTVENFRPNLVIANAIPYAEDEFKKIQIGSCIFDVHYKTTRCIVTTLNPLSSYKNTNSEPLRTLSKYRKNHNGEVCFGVYLIPKVLGEIKVGDELVVLK